MYIDSRSGLYLQKYKLLKIRRRSELL